MRVVPPLHELPDAVFVEDAVVILEEIAIIASLGSPARRGEVESLVPLLREFRDIELIRPPGTLDGGDVLRIGRQLFVGASARTNPEGARQLGSIASRHGYRVIPAPVRGCLHLKTGVGFLGDRVLVNPGWIDPSPFGAVGTLWVPAGEPWAANTLLLDDTLVVASAFPETQELLSRSGYRVEALDISEFQKAEAGLTCLSVIFESGERAPL